MDSLDFATSVAQGLDVELPSVADIEGWDRLQAGAARLARELKFPLDGCDYDRPCPDHPEEFLLRETTVTPGGSVVARFTCLCAFAIPADVASPSNA